MRADVKLARPAYAAFRQAPAEIRERVFDAIAALTEDAEPDAVIPRLPVFLHQKRVAGLDVTYYVADLSLDPVPIQIVSFQAA